MSPKRKSSKDHKGSSVKKQKVDEKEGLAKVIKASQKLMNAMTTNVTGVYDGDTLIGTDKRTKWMKIVYHGPNIPPWAADVKMIQEANLWSTFITRLKKLRRFRQMSESELSIWFKCALTKKYSLTQAASVMDSKRSAQITILERGKDDSLSVVDDESMNKWVEDGQVKMVDVEKRIVKATGLSSTLAFLPTAWRIYDDTLYVIPNDFKGMELVLGQDLLIHYDAKRNRAGFGSIQAAKNLILTFPSSNTNATLSQEWWISNVFRHVLSEQHIGTSSEWNRIRSWFSGEKRLGYYKSLLQKIIRFQPLKIGSDDNKESDSSICGEFVLLCIGADMIMHADEYNPQFHSTESGLQAFCKRLAVIGLEDSMISDGKDLVFLLGCARVSQLVRREFVPCANFYIRMMRIAVSLLNNRRAYNYKTDQGLNAIELAVGQTSLHTASALLDLVHSLSGDYQMFRYLAKHPTKVLSVVAASRPRYMSIKHAIDQHTDPRMVYFFHPQVIREYGDLSNANSLSPFSHFFKQTFSRVTGLNPRRKTQHEWEMALNHPLYKQMTQVQSLYWSILHPKMISSNNDILYLKESYKGEYRLDDSWMAGAVGVLDPQLKSELCVTLRVEDISSMAVFLLPRSRRSTKKRPEKNETTEQEAKDAALSMLEKGVKWQGCRSPVSQWTQGKTIIQVKEDGDGLKSFIVDGKKWDDVRHIKIDTKQFVRTVQVERYLTTPPSQEREGIQANSWDLLNDELVLTDLACWSRLLLYIGNFQTTIALPDIDRSGGALPSKTDSDLGR